MEAAVPIPELESKIKALQASVEQVIKGKSDVVELVSVALLARGHLLIEDVPGVGKTTLAHALARSFDCTFQRIQFTSSLLRMDSFGNPQTDLQPKKNQIRHDARDDQGGQQNGKDQDKQVVPGVESYKGDDEDYKNESYTSFRKAKEAQIHQEIQLDTGQQLGNQGHTYDKGKDQ